MNIWNFYCYPWFWLIWRIPARLSEEKKSFTFGLVQSKAKRWEKNFGLSIFPVFWTFRSFRRPKIFCVFQTRNFCETETTENFRKVQKFRSKLEKYIWIPNIRPKIPIKKWSVLELWKKSKIPVKTCPKIWNLDQFGCFLRWKMSKLTRFFGLIFGLIFRIQFRNQ